MPSGYSEVAGSGRDDIFQNSFEEVLVTVQIVYIEPKLYRHRCIAAIGVALNLNSIAQT